MIDLFDNGNGFKPEPQLTSMAMGANLGPSRLQRQMGRNLIAIRWPRPRIHLVRALVGGHRTYPFSLLTVTLVRLWHTSNYTAPCPYGLPQPILARAEMVGDQGGREGPACGSEAPLRAPGTGLDTLPSLRWICVKKNSQDHYRSLLSIRSSLASTATSSSDLSFLTYPFGLRFEPTFA